MISVDTALQHLFALARPMGVEQVPLRQAAHRVLAQPVAARRTQPPFDAASMDGYAVRQAEAEPDAMFRVVGEAAAGHGFSGHVRPGEAVRIFTGAPLPEGLDHVVIQEDVRRQGDVITLERGLDEKRNIRAAGLDFHVGEKMQAPRRLAPADIALLAAMNVAEVPVFRRPQVAVLATGDELVMPGETPGPDQIIASNSFGLAAQLEAEGAEVRLLPIARDTVASLRTAFELATGADLLITIGGASVGEHDLVSTAAREVGLNQSFYKVRMRPGKPLMAGTMGEIPMVGLPGNPVSAMVCGTIFILPMIRAMLGLPAEPAPRKTGRLAHDLGANGPREHYMRATQTDQGLVVAETQDSSLLSVLSRADALAVRAPDAPALPAGSEIPFIPL
jgi:molybdopterin molybdotransferase